MSVFLCVCSVCKRELAAERDRCECLALHLRAREKELATERERCGCLGPLNRLDDIVDSDQKVANEELSLSLGDSRFGGGSSRRKCRSGTRQATAGYETGYG